MTLRVVSDNVSKLPVRNLSDVPMMARGFADDVEGGEWGDVERAIVIVQGSDTSITILGWGESSTAYELMGLFEAAKLRVFADDLVQDD